ncbi:esterase/lipase family protein [Nocardia arthritidis]|uniref:esterase/lipase family protein n=1 Tax=Nocardia arthritidis TaxID=228602 RepID=UPI001EEB456E|nr:alpha/beta fold hydrolase [Nocardia arthritidis]
MTPGHAAATPLPVPYSLTALVTASLTATPPYNPPGANDWGCIPSAEHPRPVVLVHGLSGNAENSWQTYAPLLANEGYCVFALTYGVYPGESGPLAGIGGRRPIIESSSELAAFVAQVRRATKADQVDIVGWSEGTLVTAGYLQFDGGAESVDKVVSLAPLWAGTAIAGAPHSYPFDVNAALAPACAACADLLTGSDFINRLQASGVYSPQPHYTNIVTTADLQVQPYSSGIRDAANATNIVLQDICPINLSGHLSMSVDPTVAALVLQALDPSAVRRIPCAASEAPPGT